MLQRSFHNLYSEKERSPFKVAYDLYTELEREILKSTSSVVEGEFRAICETVMCEKEGGCCKKKDFILTMIENMLKWMQKHDKDLQNIDFADDMDFLESWAQLHEALQLTESSQDVRSQQ